MFKNRANFLEIASAQRKPKCRGGFWSWGAVALVFALGNLYTASVWAAEGSYFSVYGGIEGRGMKPLTLTKPGKSILDCDEGPNCHNNGGWGQGSPGLLLRPWVLLGGQYESAIVEAKFTLADSNQEAVEAFFEIVGGWRIYDINWGQGFALATFGREHINLPKPENEMSSSNAYAFGVGFKHFIKPTSFLTFFGEASFRLMPINKWTTVDDGYGSYNKAGLVGVFGLSIGTTLGYYK